jgi:E3 SUMO-protein ligase PIAS1
MAEAPATQPSAPVVKAFEPSESGADGIFVLDSDDEDEGRVKLELSPSSGRRESSGSANHSFEGTVVPQTQTQSRAGDEVIDLTLDSDDEGPPPPPPARRSEKRKADEVGMSPTEQIWKKGRQDIDLVSGVMTEHIHNPNSPNGFDTTTFPPYRSQSSGSQSLSHTSIGSPPSQYAMPAFSGGMPTYYRQAALAARTSSGANDARLANLHRNAYLPRLNARWPGT